MLDVGCGPGTFYPTLREFGVKIVALDASLGMVKEVQAQGVATQWPVQANAERLPVADASCDRVMSNHMLYHVPDQVAALTEMRRVLRPGGRVLISTNSQNNHIELLDLHRSAAAQLGFAASPSTEHRFNTGHLELVRSVFPTAVLHEQHAAFAFPTTASALAYYASGIIDLIDPRSADDSHQPQLLAILGAQIDAIIAEKGIFRVYKGVGVFVADLDQEPIGECNPHHHFQPDQPHRHPVRRRRRAAGRLGQRRGQRLEAGDQRPHLFHPEGRRGRHHRGDVEGQRLPPDLAAPGRGPGDRPRLCGRLPGAGQLSVLCRPNAPGGKGQLYARFEALKAKLAAEGLFDADRKRPIPVQPERVGIVTSAGAAALRDILRTLSLRWPLVDVVLFPTLVQGADAPAQIVRAIQAANRYSTEIAPIDTLIVGRGGGSIEDLWAFNDEGVARAMVASAIPTIAGVGHEVDFSIADFVADLRAATPTAAASAAVPDRAEIIANLWAVERGLAERAWDLLDFQRARLDQLTARLDRVHPRRQLDLSRQRLEDRAQRLHRAGERLLTRRQDRLAAAHLRLGALNPGRVLERGYSIVQRTNGKVVMGPEGAAPGEELQRARGDGRVSGAAVVGVGMLIVDR